MISIIVSENSEACCTVTDEQIVQIKRLIDAKYKAGQCIEDFVIQNVSIIYIYLPPPFPHPTYMFIYPLMLLINPLLISPTSMYFTLPLVYMSSYCTHESCVNIFMYIYIYMA